MPVDFMKDNQVNQLISLLDDIVTRSGEKPDLVLKDIVVMIMSTHSLSNAQRQLILDDICTTYDQRLRPLFHSKEETIPF
jgi:hypothetical protein